VLRDEGWYEVFESLEASTVGRQALEAWMPQECGLRERIRAFHATHPRGFHRVELTSPSTSPKRHSQAARSVSDPSRPSVFERASEEAYDEASLQLRRYYALKRAKVKMRAVLLWIQTEHHQHPNRNLSREILATIEQNATHVLRDMGRVAGSVGKEASREIRLIQQRSAELAHGTSRIASEVGWEVVRHATFASRTIKSAASIAGEEARKSARTSTYKMPRGAGMIRMGSLLRLSRSLIYLRRKSSGNSSSDRDNDSSDNAPPPPMTSDTPSPPSL